MTTRNPSQFIIDQYKAGERDNIHPPTCVRFVSVFLKDMPLRWHQFNRKTLIDEVRKCCESKAATGQLKRKRIKGFTGYVYMIVD